MNSFKKAGTLFFLLYASTALSQENLSYQKPPQSISDLAEAASTPTVRISSEGEWMLLLESPGLPSIKEVSQPGLRLAGMRINPANNGKSRSASYNVIRIKSVESKEEFTFDGLPSDPQFSEITWSPDETKVAFINTTDKGLELWYGELKSRLAKKLTSEFLNDTYGNTYTWAPDGKSILAKFVDDNKGKMPVDSAVPTGPVVQESSGKAAPSRTYQDLLKNPHQESLFDHYFSATLTRVTLDGDLTSILGPAIFRAFEYSPNGDYLLVETIKRPYSYLVPANLFPYTTEIFNQEGKMVKAMYNAPLAENLPAGFDAVPTGPREFGWRADKPATVYWVEAMDKGDPALRVPLRDMIYTMAAPFNSAPFKLAECYLRFNSIHWSSDQLAIVTERWWKTRAERRVYIKPGNERYRVNLFDFYYEDAYADPGVLITRKNEYNRPVLLTEGQNIFTISEGASPEGNRPFVFKFNTKTKLTDTLFRSSPPYYERPVFFNNRKFLITSREAVDTVPNYYYVDLPDQKHLPLTAFADPYPTLKGVQKQLLSYKRADGLTLTGTLYLPKGYSTSMGKLPVLMWAYPREFKTTAAAGQVKGSPYQFTRLSWGSPVYWVTRGYAVLDNADMPILGESNKNPNDTFVEQVKFNAQAAVNKLTEMGVADDKRIAVGGHSYGAFMTANLLAHTDLFAAGIARSGAYNRSLTPFGFQAEERTYWEATDVYNKMSPFTYSNRIKEPLLLIHGEADNNSGTFPLQSERFFNALKGHGATTRLVFLPAEAHSYRAKESVLHMLWEMDQWLEKYVKKAATESSAK